MISLEDSFGISESGRPKFEIFWHRFKGQKSVTFETASGKKVILKPGDIYGVQEFSKTHDIISFPNNKSRFKLEIHKSERLMKRSSNYKGQVPVKVEIPKEKAPKQKADPTAPKVKEAKREILKQVKAQKVIIPVHNDEDDDEALDKKFGAKIIEPLEEINDDIDSEELRQIMNSLSQQKQHKRPKA